jgi:hypothetical protein
MRIDAAARRTLELSQPLNGRRENSHLHQRAHLHAPLHRVAATADNETATAASSSPPQQPSSNEPNAPPPTSSASKPAPAWGASSSTNINTTSHTLLGCLDRCVTAAGSRLLAAHLAAPLTDCRAIDERVRI